MNHNNSNEGGLEMASYNQTLAMRYNRQGEEAVVDGHLHLAIKYFTDAIAL